ncbi:unnamed protein product [Heligmosomoides polygyrus]|uniref:Secreted protein n=1 Tax=Heligmosomoides polygyrus TaxID=6339 RepID=A0A183F4E4_HELPZ|nr:unnamed protein product [Heligmosomoides polygyrus]
MWTILPILLVLLLDTTLADELISARCQAKCLREFELQFQHPLAGDRGDEVGFLSVDVAVFVLVKCERKDLQGLDEEAIDQGTGRLCNPNGVRQGYAFVTLRSALHG